MAVNQHGFILSSKFYDNKNQIVLEYIATNDQGPFKMIFNQEKLVFFVETNVDLRSSGLNFQEKELKLKAFNQSKVKAIYSSSLAGQNKIKDFCLEKKIRTYEIDILPTERFLMERFIQGSFEFQAEKVVTDGDLKTYINPSLKPSNYLPRFTILSLDIETGVDNSLYSIGMALYSPNGDKELVLMRSEHDRKISENLFYLKDEESLCLAFLKYLHHFDPDVLIGWHVIGFDLKFLKDKFLKYNLEFNIGRGQTPLILDDSNSMGMTATMQGRIIIDGPPTLRSAFYKFENFKLETVATQVLGTGKDISSDQGKVEEIEKRFKEDKEALAKYNILDCKLVHDIYLKLDIYNFIISRVQNTGLLFERVHMSTTAFDFLYLPRLHRKGYVAPNRFDLDRELSGSGGLVLSPEVGLHSIVAIFDFKSLYPTIIKTFGIDPLALSTNDNIETNTPSGHSFNRDLSILPDLISELLSKRQRAKDLGQKAQEQAIKILMNSFYGIMGSTKSRFYHHDLSSAITLTGQWILKEAKAWFQQNGKQVLYGDTDSLFVKITNENEASQLTRSVNLYLQELLNKKFNVFSYLEIEHEITFDQIFFPPGRGQTEGAKKRYVGIRNGELHFKGMEFVRSDWTELAKTFQKRLFQIFFQGDEQVDEFIKSFISELETGIYDDYLVYSKRLSKDPKDYDKNIPIHVRAALLIDHKGPYRLKKVEYVITKTGPIPVQLGPTGIDYQHYIQKQIKPIADDVLKVLGSSFDGIIEGNQLSFF